MCIYSVLYENRKYQANKKNGGIIPPLPLLYDKETDRIIQDERVKYIATGCGNCIECRNQKKRHWQVRLLEDIRHNKNAIFVTLTFSDESIAKLTKELDIKKEASYQDMQWKTQLQN